MSLDPKTVKLNRLNELSLAEDAFMRLSIELPGVLSESLIQAEGYSGKVRAMSEDLRLIQAKIGNFSDNLHGRAFRVLKKASIDICDLLSQASSQVDLIEQSGEISAEFGTVARDNFEKISQKLIRAWRDFAVALENLQLKLESGAKGQDDRGLFAKFYDRYRDDLEERYPASAELTLFEKKLFRIAINAVPFVGAISEILGAQQRFAKANLTQDDTLLWVARRECVLALVELSAALGGGLLAHLGVEVAGPAFRVLGLAGFGTSTIRIATNDTPIETDLLKPLAQGLLEIPGMLEVVDSVLATNYFELAKFISKFSTDFQTRFNDDFDKRFNPSAHDQAKETSTGIFGLSDLAIDLSSADLRMELHTAPGRSVL